MVNNNIYKPVLMVAWEPLASFQTEYYLESLEDTESFFQIILHEFSNEQNKLKITFERGVEGHAMTNESYLGEPFIFLNAKEEIERPCSITFLKTKQSFLLHSLFPSNKEALEKGIWQYSILTQDPVIDIVSTYEPTIDFFTTQNKAPFLDCH